MDRRAWTKDVVNPLLVDWYQISMAYAYWLNNRHEKHAVFDLFFRKNPFGGEYSLYCGLEDSLRYLENFRFTADQIAYVKTLMPHADPDFFKWLAEIDCSTINLYAVKEGSVAFPRIPLMRVEGPLAIAQMLETALLNINNFSTLCTTNAKRYRLAAGKDKTLLEFGLRRAQGPDGGISASRCSFIGGFDGSSNVQAGYFFGLPIKGTHAHSWVQSFRSLDDLKSMRKNHEDFQRWDLFIEDVIQIRKQLGFTSTNEGELAAFISYAMAFPDNFLALVDTYDVLRSGVPNFICVAKALEIRGYEPVGIRIDSGDLAHLSLEARKMNNAHDLKRTKIVASNDINEAVLNSFAQQNHAINSFGIGTALVTCQGQPALGGVFKLVEIEDEPRIKLSEDEVKITIPGKKEAYRFVGQDGKFLMDVMILKDEEAPQAGKEFFCRHPFIATKRAFVTPTHAIPLYHHAWNGKRNAAELSAEIIRDFADDQVDMLRSDITRAINPTPYKVSVSSKLHAYIQTLRENEAPIGKLN